MLLLILSCSKSGVDNKSKNDYSNFTFYEGLSTNYIQHGGSSREYLLYIPSNIGNRKNLPVIFNFHGYFGQAVQFFNQTDLVEIADNNGVILVYPQGSCSDGLSHWNPCPRGGDNKSTADDLGFIQAMINDISTQYNIDQERIYATGYSRYI